MRYLRNLIVIFLFLIVGYSSAQGEESMAISKENADRIKTRRMGRLKDELKFLEVEVTDPGKLNEILAGTADEVDSLVITGTINFDDIETLRKLSVDGSLEALNLQNARLLEGEIPDRAFYDFSDQGEPGHDFEGGWHKFKMLKLRRLMLPEDIKRIGDDAFKYAFNLEYINIPEKCTSLGRSCFSECWNLKTNPLILPEGMEEIPYGCFYFSTIREVVLP